MKIGCCGLGIFGMIFRAIDKVIEVIVAVIIYLGLYWPIFYLTVVLGLWLWGGMTFEPSVNLALFYVGLILSLMISVVLTLRHLIFEPFGRYLDRKQEEKEVFIARQREKNARRKQRAIEKERRAHASKYQERRDYPDNRQAGYDDYSYRKRTRAVGEKPYVYRSRRDRSLIIYEYSDRFEVFRENDRGLKHIDTKWK